MDAASFLNEELANIEKKLSLQSTSFTFPEFSLVELLSFAATEEVFFYESKDENFSFLGLGVSRELETFEIDDFIRKNPNEFLVYYGQFESLNQAVCYVPEWSFIRKDGKVSLIVRHSEEYQSYSPSNIIFNPNVWESFIGPWISFDETPDSDEWREMINHSNKLFSKNELDKIVLSRKKIFTYDSPIEMIVMFREAYKANLQSSHFSIYHQINYHESFISLSPERLFTLKKRELETISLAGSTPRGNTPEEDAKLESELVSSDKLIREHDFVTTAIKERLSPLTSKIEISPLMTMKLPYIQHRQAQIKCTLKEEASIHELIGLLHPTPAVGGIPYEAAALKILEIEKGPRHQYAAPIGVISKDLSEIVVGIRSASIQGESITVFGGAGIVSGSVPEEEWIETGIKMQPFIKVINKSAI